MTEPAQVQHYTSKKRNNKKYKIDRADTEIQFLSENNTKSNKYLIPTDYNNKSSPLGITQTRPKTSVSASYMDQRCFTQKSSLTNLRQQRRFQVAHHSSSIPITVPANILLATSGRFSSHIGRVSSGTASRVEVNEPHLEAPQSSSALSPKEKRNIRSDFKSPLQNITKQINKHYKQIERLEKQKRRQEQIMLMKEEQRDLNDLNDQEIKLNLIRDFQTKRLMRYRKIEKYYNMQLHHHNFNDENEPLLDFLKVKNTRSKPNHDHDLNSVFGPLVNKNRKKSSNYPRYGNQSQDQIVKQEFQNNKYNQVNSFNKTRTTHAINDIQIQIKKDKQNKQDHQLDSFQIPGQISSQLNKQILKNNEYVNKNEITHEQTDVESKHCNQEYKLLVEQKKLQNQTEQVNSQNQYLQKEEINGQVSERIQNTYGIEPVILKSSSSSKQNYQGNQSQVTEPFLQNSFSEKLQVQQKINKPVLQVNKDQSDSHPRPTGHFQNNWACIDQEGIQSSQEGSQEINQSIEVQPKSLRPQVTVHQTNQKKNLSVINLNKVNEENEVRIESGSLNDGEFTVMARSAVVKERRKNKQEHEFNDGTGSLTKSPHSYRVQNINNVELILDSEREEVVSKNLNYLSEQIQKEGDEPSSEEVSKKMKQIMNMLGQALVSNFKKNKPNQNSIQFDQNNLRVPSSNKIDGFPQSMENDRPLLVKDIRAKMGQEIVKLMQKYKMKKSFEKTVKELMSKEILKLVKAKRLETQVMQKSVISKGTDRTRHISTNDPVIKIEDDDLNLTTIGDAQIELADLERLVNRDDQATLQPETEQIIHVQNDIEAKSEFEQVFEKVKAEQESLLRHDQHQLFRGYSPNPKSGDVAFEPGFFQYFELNRPSSFQKPQKNIQRFNNLGTTPKDKTKRKRSGLPVPSIKVDKEDRSIHAVSQYIPAAKSHYSPEENNKRMTPQHRGSELLPNLDDVQNAINEFKSVGPSFYQQQQFIPPSKSSNLQIKSQLPRTQYKSIQKNIKKDQELTLKFKNQDLSEFIDAEIMSSGKLNGTTSHITQSKSRPKQFSHKLEEYKPFEGDSASFFSATVKNFKYDVVIDSHQNQRKLIEITSSDHQQSQVSSSVTIEQPKSSQVGNLNNSRLQNQIRTQTGLNLQYQDLNLQEQSEIYQIQGEATVHDTKTGDEETNILKDQKNVEFDNQITLKIDQLGQRLMLLTNTLKQLDAQRLLSQQLLHDLEQKLGSVEAASISENLEPIAVPVGNLAESNTSQLQEELRVANTTYGGPSSLTKTEKNNYLQDQGISMRSDEVKPNNSEQFQNRQSIPQSQDQNTNDSQQFNDSAQIKHTNQFKQPPLKNYVNIENKDVSLKLQYQQQKKIFKKVDKQIENLQEQMEQTLIQLASLNRETDDVSNLHL